MLSGDVGSADSLFMRALASKPTTRSSMLHSRSPILVTVTVSLYILALCKSNSLGGVDCWSLTESVEGCLGCEGSLEFSRDECWVSFIVKSVRVTLFTHTDYIPSSR